MLVFECPSCHAKMQAADENAGKKIICPKCNIKTTVPDSADAETEAITAEPSGRPAKSTAVTASEKSKRRPREDDDDDNDGRAPSKKTKAGMGIGLILLLIFGGVGCVLCVPAILIALLVPAVSKVREAAVRTQTSNNMKQIALAAMSHQDATKFLPPPQMANAELSWRVSILPYIDQGNLFNLFDQKQAWNGPNNNGFVTMMPVTYGNPRQDIQERSKTPFQYFTGPGTLFPTPQAKVSFRDITDGTSNTFLFAEAMNPVEWSKPADMAITPNAPLPLPADRFLASFCDGSVRFIDRRKANDNVLRLLINPKDGKPIPQGVLD